MESQDDSAKPFKFDLSQPVNIAETFFGKGARMVHPCDAFAQRAGYDSWAAALDAMKAGKIVTATGPRIGRTMIDFNLFDKQVRADGLMTVVPAQDEFGIVSVGLREHFPPETLKRVEQESAQRLAFNPLQSL